MSRLRTAAAAAFFVAYLAVQAIYPVLSWFDSRFHWFAWNMYSGRMEMPVFSVVYDDGRVQRLPRLTRSKSPARVYGSSMHQARFVPPYLCARWPGVREVRLRYERGRYTRVVSCQAQV